MIAVYHRQVLKRAIGKHVSPRALAAITKANLWQDGPQGQIGHPEFHFDDSAFDQGLAYIEESRAIAARADSLAQAWAAFGRLSHSAQDFYSHSNYVALWLERFIPGLTKLLVGNRAERGKESAPPVEAIDGLDPTLLKHPRLVSGRVYTPIEYLWLIPPLRPLVKALVPKDSHAWMNLDTPETGLLFPYSVEAAVQRTLAEFERTLAAIGEERGMKAVRAFQNK